MGIKAIDEINGHLRSSLSYLRSAKIDSETLKMPRKDADAVLYTLNKCSNDLYFLSESLAKKGYGDNSLLGKLKQAFQGLFGGF